MLGWRAFLVSSLLALSLQPSPSLADCPYEFGIEWGSYGTGPQQFQIAYDMALAPDGSLVVSDHRNDQIKKFDADGNLLLSFGSPGTGPGQFRRPTAIAVDGAGNILVVELGNFRLQKFAPNGTYLTEWRLPPEDTYQDIVDIAADAAGNVYVPDPSEELLYKFGPDGTLLASWSSGDPSWRPGAVTFDENGILYISWNNQYMKLTTDLVVIQGLMPMLELYADGLHVRDGKHYYSVNDGAAVRVYEESGSLVCAVGTTGAGAGQVDQARNALPAPEGRIFVNDILTSKIVRFDPLSVPAAATTWGRMKSVYR